MQKTCINCSAKFEIFPEDQEFYTKMEVPPPSHCIDCRQQRRLAQANQLFLYKRKCDHSGKEVISNFHPESPYKVYDQEIWYSDAWDPLVYGRPYDFNRPFFEQFAELFTFVPRPNLFTGYQYDENSPYTNHAGKNKSCYFIFDSDENRDCLYSYSLNSSRDTMDCYRVRKSELCYECIDCYNSYNCRYCQDSETCHDSAFLKNCIGCKNCIMCVNLRNKKYHIKNKPVSQEEYEAFVQNLKSFPEIKKIQKEFQQYQLEFPQKYLHGIKNENVVGEYLDHSKNAYYCFDSSHLWDSRYIFQAFMPIKNSLDIQECGDGEQMYECSVSGYNSFNMKFCVHTLDQCSDAEYCMYCPHTSHLFGCMGLRHKQYCILNKQYTKEEYEDLIPQIKKHMMETGEYGEFFPIIISSFAYNQTIAQDYYPLTKEEALKKGYKWRDEEEIDTSGVTKKIPASKLPESIDDVPDDILNWAIECEASKRLFKIQPAELKLYRQLHLPIPHEHFLVRHKRRRSMRNPRKLWDRKCMKCSKDIKTAYSPERPEAVYCEECFISQVN